MRNRRRISTFSADRDNNTLEYTPLTFVLVHIATDLRGGVVQGANLLQNRVQHLRAARIVLRRRRVRAAIRGGRRSVAAVLRVVGGAGQTGIAETVRLHRTNQF